jgi:hypothetical protein
MKGITHWGFAEVCGGLHKVLHGFNAHMEKRQTSRGLSGSSLISTIADTYVHLLGYVIAATVDGNRGLRRSGQQGPPWELISTARREDVSLNITSLSPVKLNLDSMKRINTAPTHEGYSGLLRSATRSSMEVDLHAQDISAST